MMRSLAKEWLLCLVSLLFYWLLKFQLISFFLSFHFIVSKVYHTFSIHLILPQKHHVSPEGSGPGLESRAGVSRVLLCGRSQLPAEPMPLAPIPEGLGHTLGTAIAEGGASRQCPRSSGSPHVHLLDAAAQGTPGPHDQPPFCLS